MRGEKKASALLYLGRQDVLLWGGGLNPSMCFCLFMVSVSLKKKNECQTQVDGAQISTNS